MNATIHCRSCGKDHVLDQPYPYHAGFSNQGFLYNDAGNLTLVWGSYDPLMRRLFPGKHPWVFDQQEQQAFERLLKPAPSGGRWKFTNPARCSECGETISPPMFEHIYYVVFPGSIDADDPKSGGLQMYVVEEDLTSRCS